MLIVLYLQILILIRLSLSRFEGSNEREGANGIVRKRFLLSLEEHTLKGEEAGLESSKGQHRRYLQQGKV